MALHTRRPWAPDFEDISIEHRKIVPRRPEAKQRALEPFARPAIRLVMGAIDAQARSIVLKHRVDGHRIVGWPPKSLQNYPAPLPPVCRHTRRPDLRGSHARASQAERKKTNATTTSGKERGAAFQGLDNRGRRPERQVSSPRAGDPWPSEKQCRSLCHGLRRRNARTRASSSAGGSPRPSLASTSRHGLANPPAWWTGQSHANRGQTTV
jgi:hypothetical protein